MKSSLLISDLIKQPAANAVSLYDQYCETLSNLLEVHAPVKIIKPCVAVPWFHPAIVELSLVLYDVIMAYCDFSQVLPSHLIVITAAIVSRVKYQLKRLQRAINSKQKELKKLKLKLIETEKRVLAKVKEAIQQIHRLLETRQQNHHP